MFELDPGHEPGAGGVAVRNALRRVEAANPGLTFRDVPGDVVSTLLTAVVRHRVEGSCLRTVRR